MTSITHTNIIRHVYLGVATVKPRLMPAPDDQADDDAPAIELPEQPVPPEPAAGDSPLGIMRAYLVWARNYTAWLWDKDHLLGSIAPNCLYNTPITFLRCRWRFILPEHAPPVMPRMVKHWDAAQDALDHFQRALEAVADRQAALNRRVRRALNMVTELNAAKSAPATTTATPSTSPPPPPPTPVCWLRSWAEILKTLGLRSNRRERESLRRLNQQTSGPIRTATKGNRPLVDQARLVAWWNDLDHLGGDEAKTNIPK